MKRVLAIIFALVSLRASAYVDVHGLMTEYYEKDGVVTKVEEHILAAGANFVSPVPQTISGYTFTHWTASIPADAKNRDEFGRAYDQMPYHLEGRIELTAHYLPTTRDSDNDGVADALEIYWYGDLSKTGTSDTDGDGFTFAEELAAGTNPLMSESELEGPISYASGEIVQYNPRGYGEFVVRSDTEGLVTAVDEFCRPGTVMSTPTLSPTSSTFAYWTRNGVPCRDEWGRALEQITISLSSTSEEFVAVGVSDANTRYKLYWYGNTSISMDSDTDGDGMTFAEEIAAGTNPLMAETDLEGPISYAAGEIVQYNPHGYGEFVVRSDTDGLVTAVDEFCRPGTVVSTPSLSPTTSNFAYWTRNGVACRDEWGRALDQITIQFGSTSEELVAVGVSDANTRYKLYWYGNTSISMDSDTDGDGMTFAEEIAAGTNPLMADSELDGAIGTAAGRVLLYDPEGEVRTCEADSMGYSGVFDGREHGISVKVKNPMSGYTVTYAFSDQGPFVATMPKFKDVGSYKIWYKVSADGYEDYIYSESVTISQGILTLTDIDLSSVNTIYDYDAKGHTINSAALADILAAMIEGDFKIRYSKDKSETSWSDTPPFYTDIGVGKVWFQVIPVNYTVYQGTSPATVTINRPPQYVDEAGTTNFWLQVSAEFGAISGATSGWYKAGTKLVLRGNAESGYHFADWTGDLTNTKAPNKGNYLLVNMDRSRTIEGEFEPMSRAIGKTAAFRTAVGAQSVEEAELIASGMVPLKGTALWQEYLVGTDPNDVNDRFITTIAFDANGVPQVSWSPAMNGEGVREGERIYTVYGAKDLGGAWEEVPAGQEGDYKFFKVSVDLP